MTDLTKQVLTLIGIVVTLFIIVAILIFQITL